MASNNHFGMVGRWHEPNAQDMNDLERTVLPGDRLEFSRAGEWYAHWGIYVGEYNGMEHAVIHFGMFEGGAAFSKKKTSGSAVSANSKPEVRADSIRAVLGTLGKVRINNSMDKAKTPLSADAVVRRAKKMHRERVAVDYNLIKSNCEHFVNLCRYDNPSSDQVDAAIAGARTALYLVLLVGAVVAILGIAMAVLRPRNQ
ncbi:HRAS-like suppressor 3 isoform X2 [Acanthaster planci]|uniref:HRAS-like suppressor 3 isoform X2 n=1 Tax=Acanthaster planci TaxID=133434 RepID=A0A8B8A3K8_ACAPL|nr:HRAS-like suppressor 3 isoform X2 [Acanthaster planci]